MKTMTCRAAAVGAGLALSLTSLATAAAAHERGAGGKDWRGGHRVTTIADGLTSPLLGLTVDQRGTTYVAQTFTGTITAIDRRGGRTDVVTGQGTQVTGVAAGKRGALAWIEQSEADGRPVGSLKVRARDGRVTTVTTGLAQYELDTNPDGGVDYGFVDLDEACKADFPSPPEPPSGPPNPDTPPPPPGPEPEPGDINPNPYALAFGPKGSFYVADAGGNTILRVSRSGRISTVALLPPVPFTIPSAEVAAGLGLPSCTAGETYLFQPVPTDVERGRNGMLYVSSLPGGPEDASLGYRGGVYRVNPWTGHVKRIAWGLLGAVDLALDHRGRIYVAELFDNAITRVGHGPNRKVAGVPSPGAVEFAQGKLVVTSGNGFGDFGQPVASVVRVKP